MDYNMETMVETLEQAVSDSLENLVFLEVENVKNLTSMPDINPRDFVVSLKTLEPFEENIFFIFTQNFANEIVCEMAGVPDGNFADDIMKDALGELTNTMVGRFMANLVPDNQVFELDLPVCERFSDFGEHIPSDGINKIMSFEIQGFQMYAFFEFTKE